MIGRLACAAAALLLCGPAQATPDCSSFTDNVARLACYDAVAKSKAAKPVAAKPNTAPAVTPAMFELRSKLDKAFLEAAINIEVSITAKRDAFNHGKVPQLVLFGYLNRAAVYQVITKTDLIRNARQAGFQSLDAFSKGEDGRWTFDLTTTGQTCSRDLCF